MKKDRARDIAEDGFADYARWRRCTRTRCEEIIRNAVFDEYREMPPEKLLLKAEEAINEAQPLLRSIDAAHKTFEQLERCGKDYIAKAVQFVYCANPNRKPSRNEISMRARAYAMKICADERTVYRWLREARKLYAYNIGVNSVDKAPDWLSYGLKRGML